MPSSKIVFLPYKLHFRNFLFALGKKTHLTVLLPPEKTLPKHTTLHGVRIQYKQFGADKIKRLIGREIRTLKYVDHLDAILDTQKPDVLITCEVYHWYTLQAIAYKKRHPKLQLFVISETKRWPRNIVAHIIKRILFWHFRRQSKYIDHMFTYTSAAGDFLKQRMPNMPASLLPTPVDTNVFTPDPHKRFCKDGTLRLLMNARYSPYKRHKDIFAAIARLHARGHRVHLTCISREQKRREEVVQLAQNMGVDKLVTFAEPVGPDEVSPLYHAHDVLVQPSYNEAIGMVVPEAMACGIPTITSDTVGANVYVLEGKTGFIYPTGDVAALTNILERCFDAAMLQDMGKAAHKHIVQHFTPEVVTEMFMQHVPHTN